MSSLDRVPEDLRIEWELACRAVVSALGGYETATRVYLMKCRNWDFVREGRNPPRWQLESALDERDEADWALELAHGAYVDAREREFETTMRVLEAVGRNRHRGERPGWAIAA